MNCYMNVHHRKYFSVNIAFWNYYVIRQRESIMPSVVKNSWNWTLAGLRDLVLILFSKVILELFYKKGVLKNLALFTGKRLCHSLFLSCNFIKKETLTQGFSRGLCKIFKNTFFTEHLWMHASILQKLLTLYFAIINSC